MKISIQNLLRLHALIAGLGVIFTPTIYLQAATFTVTTTNVSGPGSLPVAIAQANAASEESLIQISVTNTISLGSVLPTITGNTTVVGAANVPTVISGGGTLPLFTFATGTTNSLSNLVLANGYTANNDGAAINNAGLLFVNSCIISNNQSENGGAIYNSGILMLSKCQLLGNQSVFNGGAVFNAGSLAVVDLTVSNNLAAAGFGGGIYNYGALSLSVLSSTFVKNYAIGGSGGSGYDGGDVGGGSGGGGGGFGGALFSSSGNISITNSTFVQNLARGGNGGVGLTAFIDFGGYGGGPAGGIGAANITSDGSSGGFGSGGGGGGGAGGNGGFGGGGGAAGSGGSNIAVGYGGYAGGIGGEGYFLGGSGGGGGAGLGGAIFLQNGNCSLVNCTIINNSSAGGLGGELNGLANYSGTDGKGIAGGIFNYSGTVSLLNTIVAGNSVSNGWSDLMGDMVGIFVSSGYNLIGNNQGATNLSINDFQNVTANLGPLQDNGGSTLTCVPLPGSYAIGYGTGIGAPSTDQRGVPRPQNGACDIGAVQAVTNSPVIIGAVLKNTSGFSLNMIFDSSNSYRIQASTNLTTWINLITNGAGGALNFIDTSATSQNYRFYRTATP